LLAQGYGSFRKCAVGLLMSSDNIRAESFVDPIIKVSGLSKKYHIYKRQRDRAREYLLPWAKKRHKEFWALKDASFTVDHGETVGIIGKNGSGKSTLLQILADTLTPSAGEVQVNGRVAALLELGSGFNPEFTGRENVFLNAAIMGVPRHTIEERLHEVIAFAELESYIDQPVRTYSSGMYVRLAFSTAINMDPDILIVDEALAVGDIRFQRKCFRLFNDFQTRGKTILFVTHAVELIRTHCNRAIFINDGEIQEIGEPRDVVHSYLNSLFSDTPDEAHAKSLEQKTSERDISTNRVLNQDPTNNICIKRRSYNPMEYRWGNGNAKIIDYLVKCGDEVDPVCCDQGSVLDVWMSVHFENDLEKLIYGLTVKTVDGITVYGANTRSREIVVSDRQAGDVATLHFQFKTDLIPGVYFFSLGVAVDDDTFDNLAIDRRYDLFHIDIEGPEYDFGISNLDLQFDEDEMAELESSTTVKLANTSRV